MTFLIKPFPITRVKVITNQKRVLHGFTLLELIIAIAIFSVVSLAGFTIFDTVLRGDENSKVHSARQNELQRAFLLIERDFLQITKRTMRIDGDSPSDNFLLSVF